jgi:hypothetical protein
MGILAVLCVISSTYVLIVLYSYLDLTHRIEHIPPASFRLIVGRFIPGIVILLLTCFYYSLSELMGIHDFGFFFRKAFVN